MPAGDHRAVRACRQMQVQERAGRHGRDLRTAARDDPGRKPLPVRADRGLLARGRRGGFQHVARWVVALPGTGRNDDHVLRSARFRGDPGRVQRRHLHHVQLLRIGKMLLRTRDCRFQQRLITNAGGAAMRRQQALVEHHRIVRLWLKIGWRRLCSSSTSATFSRNGRRVISRRQAALARACASSSCLVGRARSLLAVNGRHPLIPYLRSSV